MKHLDSLRPVKLDKLTTRHLDRLYVKLTTDGLSSASVRKVHYIVSSALKQARRHKLVGENVANDADPPKVLRPDTRPPTVEELGRMLDAATDANFKAFLFAAATTGCRRGELAALRWGDVDLAKALLTVRHSLAEDSDGVYMKATKTNRVRTVALDAETITVLTEHRERAEKSAGEVGSPLDGTRLVFSPRPGNDLPYTPKILDEADDSTPRQSRAWRSEASRPPPLRGLSTHRRWC